MCVSNMSTITLSGWKRGTIRLSNVPINPPGNCTGLSFEEEIVYIGCSDTVERRTFGS